MVREASLVDRRQLNVFEPSSLPGLSQTLDFATFAPEIAQLNNSHVLYHVALESVTKGCGKLQPPCYAGSCVAVFLVVDSVALEDLLLNAIMHLFRNSLL